MEHRSAELAERRSTLTFLEPRDERSRSSNERARRYPDSEAGHPHLRPEPGGSSESAYSDIQGLRRVRSWLRGIASLPSPFGSDPPVCGVRRNRMALLIACSYHDAPHDSMKLTNSWKDIRTMRMLLLKNGWKEEEIIVLADYPSSNEPDLPFPSQGQTRPTRRNIMRALRKLVKGVQSGDIRLLHISGHGGARMTKDSSRGRTKSGLDSFFIPCDYWKSRRGKRRGGSLRYGDVVLGSASKILDTTLRQTVVDPLPAGSKLIAIIDCCCGGALLDLPYEAERGVIQATAIKLTKIVTKPVRKMFTPSIQVTLSDTEASSSKVFLPKSLGVDERVGRQGRLIRAGDGDIHGTVISIASCGAGSTTYETNSGGLLITEFARALEHASSRPLTLGELHDQLRHGQESQHNAIKEHTRLEGLAWNDDWLPPVPQFCFSQHWNWNELFTLAHS